MYTQLRFLNVAERAGTSPELASAYSRMILVTEFAQLHFLSETYVDRSIAVVEEVNQPSILMRVSVLTNLYKLRVGKWDEVRARVEEAMAICEQLGNYSRWSLCAAMLGEGAVIAGDIQYAMNIQKLLLEDARRRQNPLHQCWGLLGVATNNIRLGNAAAAISMLEEALQILEENPNLPSSMNTNGRLALAYLRLGQDDKAVIYAGKVLVLAANISPNAYSMDIGFAAVANVYFELWEKTLQDPIRQLDSDKHKLSAEQAIKLLRSFQKVFPIGQPITPYYQGWYEWLTGKHKAGIKSWNKGLEAAKKFNMPYEEGLIRVKLGSYLQDDPNVRREHFERAIQIFEKMGATHELKVA
jgi:tetratricopeptide (TPR) repeat protein